MSVVRTDKSDQEAEIAISIGVSDYKPKLDEELKKYQQKAHMKGFRKGKVPLSMIKKMYGKAMLADTVNQLLQEKLGGFLKDEKLDILGQPLPSKDQETFDFDLNSDRDFVFLFDVGLTPQFELKGVDDSTVVKFPKVIVTDEMVGERMALLQKQHGDEIHPEDGIESEDRLTINALELEGEELKKKGFETAFKILVSQIADENLKNQVLESKKGDKIRFDIFELEADRSEDFVRKYFLNMEESEMDLLVGNWFEGTIEEVHRIAPAKLEQEFFAKVFGEGEVTSEEEARQSIKEELENYYLQQSEALLYKAFQEELLRQNQVDLPDEFLKRWLLTNNEEMSASKLESDYPDFSENLIWNLIERRIKEAHDLKVDRDEVKDAFRNQVKQYFNSYPVSDDIIESSVDRLMTNQEQFGQTYNNIMSDKIFETIRDLVTLEDEMLTLEDFELRLKQAREAAGRDAGGVRDEEE